MTCTLPCWIRVWCCRLSQGPQSSWFSCNSIVELISSQWMHCVNSSNHFLIPLLSNILFVGFPDKFLAKVLIIDLSLGIGCVVGKKAVSAVHVAACWSLRLLYLLWRWYIVLLQIRTLTAWVAGYCVVMPSWNSLQQASLAPIDLRFWYPFTSLYSSWSLTFGLSDPFVTYLKRYYASIGTTRVSKLM